MKFAATGLLLGALSGPAAAADSDPVLRMDTYFLNVRAPEVYRALAGLGAPKHLPDSDPWAHATLAQKAVLGQLLPALAPSNPYAYPRLNHCRGEAPKAILFTRVAALGPHHPYIRQWLTVERAMLSVCGAFKAQVAQLPPAMKTKDPTIARLQEQDRAYQYASLLFYSGKAQAARAAYRAVALDRSDDNLLRAYATYMAAAIGAGTTPDGLWGAKPFIPVAQSLKEIDAIIADPVMRPVHALAAGLIGWIANYQDGATKAQVDEALGALQAPLAEIETDDQTAQRYLSALTDISYLHADLPDKSWFLDGAIPTGYDASHAMADAAKKGRLAAWLVFPESPYSRGNWAKDAPRLSGDLMQFLTTQISAHRNDVRHPWLHIALGLNFWDTVNALDIADTGNIEQMVDDEILRVQKNPDDDEALAALPFDFYNLERMLWRGDLGYMYSDSDNDTVRRRVQFDTALKNLEDFPFKSSIVYADAVEESLKYLMVKGYIAMARRLRDRLHLDSPGNALAWQTNDLLIVLAEDETHLVRALAMDHAYIPREYLNQISIEELWHLARRTELSRGVRALFARTAWTRSYALSRAISGTDDALMRRLNPEITKAWKSQSGRTVAPANRQVLADVLASPGMNIVMETYARMPGNSNDEVAGLTGMDRYNHDDNNWWCAWKSDLHARALRGALDSDFGTDFLPDAKRASFAFRHMDRSELKALSRVESAPALLTRRVIQWVKHPGFFGSRARQPEALANAIRATRWGCYSQGSHAAYSRQAFMLLQTMFPHSKPAKRTRYWYACPMLWDGCKKEDPLVTLSQ